MGKLLGPKGNSLKRLQEETMTKMAILGKGSFRDRAKEEELRNNPDPKYRWGILINFNSIWLNIEFILFLLKIFFIDLSKICIYILKEAVPRKL